MARFLGLRGSGLTNVISAACGLCFLCFGYAQGVLGGLLTVPSFLERFPQIDTINNRSGHNARLQGITMGTWNLGCFASAILTIFVGDLLGRRKTILLGLMLWSIGEVVQCSSYSLGQFIAGRFIAGFGNGFTTSTVPAYQAECVKSHRKGTVLMISAGVFVAAGLSLSYWLTFAFAYASNTSAAWRIPIAFQIIFALIAFVLLLFLPESPRWLILTGCEQEALTVFAALNDTDAQDAGIRDEFLQIKDAILVTSQGSAKSVVHTQNRRNLHRVILGCLIQVFQQLSGINLALQYLALVFQTQTSYSPSLARLLAGCASTEYFLASFIVVIGIDQFWGRRSLMMFGAAGMCLCMVFLTILTYLWQVKSAGGTNIAATVFLFGFSTFFAIGWQGMAWLYQVEIVPLGIRGAANALSTSANWMFNFIVALLAPVAFHRIGYKTYTIFAATNCAIIPLIYFFYPETACRSLEEVDMLFQLANESPGNSWLNVVRISQLEPLWYGREGKEPFVYEMSAWHQRFAGNSASGATLGEKDDNLHYSPSSGDWLRSGRSHHRFTAPVTSSSEPQSQSRSPSTSERMLFQKHTKNHPSRASVLSTATTASKSKPNAKRHRSWHSTLSVPSKPLHSASPSDASAYSAHTTQTDTDPDWRTSDMAPPPLHIVSRSTTAGSVRTERTGGASVSVPGRIGSPRRGSSARRYGPGIVRTASGREMYAPDGVGEEWNGPGGGMVWPRRPQSSQSSLSRFAAREAGRGA